ncbi:MAG: hypothetical protein A2010_05280 [Nitrospirae bacterium GWD2_57_9]|nr:MAG: hypothetical protein A2010_05280 [Nitrospirae bacterium GWD2_57_9]
MDVLTILFWLSIFVLFYAYAGYPLLVRLIAFFRANAPKRSASHLPSVTLLISAYNEEAVIEDKIRNSLALRYPRDLLEIVVVSDGSDDGTAQIARGFAGQGVRLNHYEGRIGKTACLNKAVPDSNGDIIVFSDANALYDADALKHLAENFADPGVGLVTGYTRYASPDSAGASVGLYAAIEKFTKQAESEIGSCVGADGALFALRRQLYRPLRQTDINDFVIPLNVVRQGFRAVLDERVFCVEQAAGDTRAEFRRQVRITNRTLRALFANRDLFDPVRHGLFAFQLFSHKAVKFVAPFFFILFIVCTVLQAGRGPGYFLLLLAMAGFGLLAAAGRRDRRRNVLDRLSSLCGTFAAANAAIIGGWFQFLKGERYTTWTPIKR